MPYTFLDPKIERMYLRWRAFFETHNIQLQIQDIAPWGSFEVVLYKSDSDMSAALNRYGSYFNCEEGVIEAAVSSLLSAHKDKEKELRQWFSKEQYDVFSSLTRDYDNDVPGTSLIKL